MDIRFWSNEEYDKFLAQVTAYDASIDLLKKANTQQDTAHSELVKRVATTETTIKGLQTFDAEVWAKLGRHDTADADFSKRVGSLESTSRSLEEADKGIRSRLDTSEKKYADLLDLYKNLSKQIDGVKASDTANDAYARQSITTLLATCQALSAKADALNTTLQLLAERVTKLETPPVIVSEVPPVEPPTV
jgi:chromosome segregation ATPase